MKLLIPLDSERNWNWAKTNGIVSLTWDELDWFYQIGTEEQIPESDQISEVEIDYHITGAGSTRHPFGSTTATEKHSPDIYAEVNGKSVTVPAWLESEILDDNKKEMKL